MHALVGEVDVGLDGDDLTGSDRASDSHNVMGGQADKMSGKTVPLFTNASFIEDSFACGTGLVVSVARSEQGDNRFLAFQVDGVPLGLFGSKFSADVEGAGDVHGHVIKRAGEIEHDEFVGFDFVAVGKVMDGVDVAAGTNDGEIRSALCAAIKHVVIGARFDLILID